jgi:1,4-dihydroxy-6-naphthoate synthase
MTLTLGFSPCPNDTFIFDALVNNKIDTEGLQFEVLLEDVETLNKWALESRLDITKLSLPAYFRSTDNYVLLNSGGALGKGAGPLLVAKTNYPLEKVEQATIAIPGLNTTANLLLTFAFPKATNKFPFIFSEIENAVLSRQTDLGVIIHESRFTYKEKGLHKLLDLGEYWEEKMRTPIPLGGIAIRRSIDRSVSLQVQKLIRKSLEFAFANYPALTAYVKEHSQEMSEPVMRQHIELYVNNYSLDLGEDGRQAVRTLRQVYRLVSLPLNAPATPSDLFL